MKTMRGLRAVILILTMAVTIGGCDLFGGDHIKKAKDYLAQGKLKAAVIEYKNVLQDDPRNAQIRQALGELYLRLGNPPAAEKEFRRASEIRPDDVELKLLIARSLLMDGQFDEALSTLAPLIESGHLPEPEGTSLQAQALAGQGKVDEAEQIYRSILATHAEDSEATLGLARVLASRKQFSEAKALVDQVLKRSPDDIDAWLLQASLALVENRYEDALKAFETAWGDGKDSNIMRSLQARFGIVNTLLALEREEEALPHVEALMKQLPTHPLPHYWRARIAYKQKDQQQAIDELLQVIRVQPDHVPSNFLLGSIYFSQGKLAQAETYLQKYVRAVPDDIQARKLLAAVRLRLQSPEGALETLDPLLTQAVQDPQLLALAGSAALHGGKLDQGVSFLKKALKSDPDNRALQTELGMAYLSKGDTQTAIKELEAAIAKGDEAMRAQSLLVLAHLRDKDFDKASQVTTKMLASGKQPALAHSLSGMVAWAQGRLDEAVRAYKKAIESDTTYVPARLDLARLEHQRGHLKQAKEYYESVLALDGDNLTALLGEARLMAQQGEEQAAIEFIERARRAHPEALAPRLILGTYYLNANMLDKARDIAAEAIAIGPDDPAVLALSGRVALASGETQDAIRDFSQLVRTRPRDADAHFDLARAYILAKQNPEARRELEEALRLHPGLVAAAEILARLEIQDGRVREARQAIGRIKKIEGMDALAGILEGDLLQQQGKLAAALKSYRSILAAFPDNREALVRVYLVRKRMDDAKADETLAAWLEHHPDDRQVRLTLASDLLSLGRYPAAIEAYERLLKDDPADSTALNNLAWLYDQQGDPRALETARKAYESKPTDGAIIDTYGWMLVKYERLDEGLPLLEKAVVAAPDNRDIRYHLAIAYVKKGQLRRARKLLDKMRGNPLEADHIKALEAMLNG